jgi:hypothetical protein
MKKMPKTFQFFPVGGVCEVRASSGPWFSLLEDFIGVAESFFADLRLRAQGQAASFRLLSMDPVQNSSRGRHPNADTADDSARMHPTGFPNPFKIS